jgi:uncharacterized protein (TIGR00255 family)
MIKSMTGFGRARGFIPAWGRVSVEIRSTNRRFLDIAAHLPEVLLHLEQKLKDEIGRAIKRGHIICRIEANPLYLKKPVINKRLIKEYYLALRRISRQLKLKDINININLLAGLPGVWSVESEAPLSLSWAKIKPVVKRALTSLSQRRQQEGRALYQDLRQRARRIGELLAIIKTRSKMVIGQRLKLYKSEEEKSSFLRSADINEEIVRLSFHLKNFTRCLKNKKAMGKELDFILQEMQREANTIGGKSIDAAISGKVVRMKSEIEKMREQVQNVE